MLKPDYGVSGGFEVVVGRVEQLLRDDGHEVTRLSVAMGGLPHRIRGLAVPDAVWDRAPEYFRHLAAMEAFERIDVGAFDAVLSTQSPSYAVDHPRHLSLFYHHHRIYYDLAELYVRAGFAGDRPGDAAIHQQAVEGMRATDRPRLAAVTHFLAGSEVVADRLARFNGRHDASVFHAGIGVVEGVEYDARGPQAGSPDADVLCVSRLEFPKRPELFVHAMKYLPEHSGAIIGAGGRAAWVRSVDARLSTPGADLDAVDPTSLWCTTGTGADMVAADHRSNVELLGRVDDTTLDRLLRDAACVVAPAYDEDYGLTAIEAMGHGVPVVVCRDGGGLAILVEDGVDGFVVEPTGRAIAEAVGAVTADPERAARMGAAGRAKAATLTWDRAADELRAGLAKVLG